jgi:hypothetical protein
MLLFFSAILYCYSLVEAGNIYIGAITDIYSQNGKISHSGLQTKAAILMALDEVNYKSDGLYDNILAKTEIKASFLDPYYDITQYIDAAIAMKTVFDNAGIAACIGPGDDTYAEGWYNISIFK